MVHPGTNVVEPRTVMSPEPTILVAGRLVPEKGVDVLIRAFARIAPSHPTARLVVAGDGPSRDGLASLATDLGLAGRVEFRGRLAHADTLAAIRQAWCVCVPSLWQEPFGMIAAEAQMHGVAVVASRAGGLAEIVEDGVTGHLVAPGDADSLAARLAAACADPDAARRLGAAGHERARERFSIDAFADRFEAVYHDAMRPSENRP